MVNKSVFVTKKADIAADERYTETKTVPVSDDSTPQFLRQSAGSYSRRPEPEYAIPVFGTDAFPPDNELRRSSIRSTFHPVRLYLLQSKFITDGMFCQGIPATFFAYP